MSPGCTYVAQSVLGEITLIREEDFLFSFESQALQGRKFFFINSSG